MKKNMSKGAGIGVLLLAIVCIVGLGLLSAFGVGENKTGAASKIKLGLDLAGGVSITYQVVEDNPTEEQIKDTVYKLQKRVESYSTEAVVYREGEDRINVEIPGVSDANTILQDLGKPGSLEFRTEDGAVILDGTGVKTANGGSATNSMGNKEYVVELKLTDEGAKAFAQATAANIGKRIPIVYDGEIICDPIVNSSITGGSAQITGMKSYEDAELLASQIRIGSLQLELEELRSNVVGAKLGEEAISTSLKAAVIGIVLVMVFMIIMYLVPGFAASIALVLYVVLELIILNAFEITLTLPGIAGIILSIGMAVDANVIIFARIKEELALGHSVKGSIDTGFKKALSAIVDGNITTLIAAIVLGLMGSGSIKGFAQTLAIGIVLSMFTALIVTRLVLYALFAIGFKNEKFYGKAKERKSINFVGKRKAFFGLSIAVIAAGMIFMGVQAGGGNGALNYSLEFMGGTSTNVTFNENYSIEKLEADVIPVVSAAINDSAVEVQPVSGTNEVIIKTKELKSEEREVLNNALEEEFGVDKTLITAESISSTISGEMRNDAIMAVVVATIFMLIYIWFRFKDIRFAASAVMALLQDVLVVLTFYAFSRISVGSTFIACMLTIVGYSINATIVIFDRIREKMATKKGKDSIADLVNECITQTLSRSVNTTITTFIMVAVLFIMGVNAIKGFALPLMVGIICGGYSSVCITGALWFVLKKIGSKKA